MAIDTTLLVAAPILQDLLRDKDTGLPLRSGVITFYQNNNHTILKNWYIQDPANPVNFIAGPNPLTLTGIGTFADQQGNDVIPYFYPYDENNKNTVQTYFVRVESSVGVLQFTRDNFPLTNAAANNTGLQTLENYIFNNVFWRNIESINLASTTSDQEIVFNLPNGTPNNTYHYSTLAPSYHDGFAMSDMIALRDQQGASDSLTFKKFPAGSINVLSNDITPEFYLEWKCTAGLPAQQLKCLQFPLQLHLSALENQLISIVFHADNVSTTTPVNITVQILQYTGTDIAGVAPTNCIFTSIGTFTITAGWHKYQTNATRLPSAQGVTIGTSYDDAIYVQFVFPTTDTFDINFAKPQLYLGNEISNNEYQTYDIVDTIANSPRTGDVKMSINSFAPFGWVPMNDGSIGATGSVATIRANADTWPLYTLLYNTVLDHWAPVSGGRTGSAIADFNSGKTLTLPRALGRVLAGANLTANIPQTFTTNYAGSHFNLTVASSALFPTGTPVQLTNTGGALPVNLAVNNVYYVININATTIQLAGTLEGAYAATAIDIGGDQTGTSKVQTALGAWIGVDSYQLQSNDLPAHVHGAFFPGENYLYTGGGSSRGGGVSAVQTAATTGTNTTTNAPISLVQPTTFMNYFIKL